MVGGVTHHSTYSASTAACQLMVSSYDTTLYFILILFLFVSLHPSVFLSILHTVSTVAHCLFHGFFFICCTYKPWGDNVTCTISRSIDQRSRSHGSFNLFGWGWVYPSRSLIYNLKFFMAFLPEASFGLRVLSLPASACLCVCLSVCVSVNPELVRAINHHTFKLEPPKLDKRCKTTWLRSLLFCGAIDLDLQGQI